MHSQRGAYGRPTGRRQRCCTNSHEMAVKQLHGRCHALKRGCAGCSVTPHTTLHREAKRHALNCKTASRR
eukprot:15467990-Alexandrium_andersonii.AAC.1